MPIVPCSADRRRRRRAPARYGSGTSIRVGRSLPAPKTSSSSSFVSRNSGARPIRRLTWRRRPSSRPWSATGSTRCARAPRCTAASPHTETAGGGFSDGAARFILDGDRADRLAVVTAAGVFVVDASNVIARRAGVFDPVLHVADLSFDRTCALRKTIARTPTSNELGTLRSLGWRSRPSERVNASSTSHLEHLKQRNQFGVPIGSFQALQHKAADMHVAIERARALSYFSALTIAADDPRRRLAAMMAKAAAGDAQSLVVRARHAVLRRNGIHLGERSAVRH